MELTTETAEYLEYSDGQGATYRFTKTNPVVWTITIDFNHPQFNGNPENKTWQEIKTEMENL